MANFDFLAGIREQTAKTLVGQFYTTAPADDSPFKGEIQQDVDNLGSVTLDWSFQNDFATIFGAPAQQNWNAALGPDGQTNEDAGVDLPTGPMIQLTTSFFQASYTIGNGRPINGSSDLEIYATVDVDDGEISLTSAAILFKNLQFVGWDPTVFRDILLAQMFDCADSIMTAIQLPPFDLPGLPLAPSWTVQVMQDYVFGAAILTEKATAVTFSGFTPPADGAFVLISSDAVVRMTGQFASQLNSRPITGEVPYQNFADCTLDAETAGVLVLPESNFNPLTCSGTMTVTGTAYIDVTDQGLGAGGQTGSSNPFQRLLCSFEDWMKHAFKFNQSSLHSGYLANRQFKAQKDDGGITFKYGVANSNPLAVQIKTVLDDSSLSLTVTDCTTPQFSYTADPSNQQAIGKLQTAVLDPSQALISKTYAPKVPAAVIGRSRGLMLNQDSPVGSDNKLTARQLAFGPPVRTDMQMMKITCTLSVTSL